MSNVTQRITDLTERRRRLWARTWAEWTPDMEARVHHLTRLLEEAWFEKRKAQAELGQPVGRWRRMRGLSAASSAEAARVHAGAARRSRRDPADGQGAG